MKKYLFIAASALALASCSSEDFVGTEGGNVENGANKAIGFGGGTGKITRASVLDGDKAANALNNNFVVFGYKTNSDKSTSTVFDHYTIKWNNKAGQTVSNTKGWEYVGITPNSLSSLKAQTIKYWDYSATQYDYVAFSFGKATQGEGEGQVKATQVTTTPKLQYTLKGDVQELAKCFIADRITAKNGLTVEQKKSNKLVGYKDDVQFNFRSLATKVTMGIYEIVPGYSIKDVKFYSDANTKLTDEKNAPTLYSGKKDIPSGNGTVTVTFPTTDKDNTDYNKAHVSFAATNEDKDMISAISFDELSKVGKEKAEAEGNVYIGRNITEFSTPKNTDNSKKYKTVIPAHVGTLTLKVDYTLVSIDGSGETIKVTGATAVVPEKYTNWEPNYAYTYIFKISDKTNGSTGGKDDPKGLYPITFDAIVTETETGKQETITKVENNSITTYAKDEINNEYKTNANIYVSVNNSTPLHIKNGNEDITPTNVALYTAAGTGSYATITEAIVAHCLASGTATGTTAGEKKLTTGDNSTLTVTPATGLSIVDKIEAKDAVDGNAISGNFAKFTPKAEGTYVFEFTDGKTKYYKVIKVVTATK